MLSLRPICCCSESTAPISLAWVNTSGPTQAPKNAPRVGGVGARAGLTVVVTCGAGAEEEEPAEGGPGDDENGSVTTAAATAATTRQTSPAISRRSRPVTGSDPVPAGVENPEHGVARHDARRDRERERHPALVPVAAQRPPRPAVRVAAPAQAGIGEGELGVDAGGAGPAIGDFGMVLEHPVQRVGLGFPLARVMRGGAPHHPDQRLV